MATTGKNPASLNNALLNSVIAHQNRHVKLSFVFKHCIALILLQYYFIQSKKPECIAIFIAIPPFYLFSSSMLPPSDSQKFHQASQVQCLGDSATDNFVIAAFEAFRLSSPIYFSGIFTYRWKRGFEEDKHLLHYRFIRPNLKDYGVDICASI